MLITEKAINEKGYQPSRAPIEQGILKPNKLAAVCLGGSLTGGGVKGFMTNSNITFEGHNALVEKCRK